MAKRRRPGDDPPLHLDEAALAAALEAELGVEKPAALEPGKHLRILRVGYGQQGVVRRRDNRWRLQYRGEPEKNGHRRQHSVPLGYVDDMTLAEARASAARVLESLAPRRIVPGSTCKWEDWVARYVTLYLPMLRLSSQQTAGSIIRAHLQPEFSGRLLNEITPARIQSLIARWRLQRTAPSTIRTRYAVLCRILRQAEYLGLAAHVPDGKQVKLPRSEAVDLRRRNRAFSTNELAQILTAAEEPWHTLFSIMAFCGLRISEALGMKWGDLDLAAGRLRVVRQAVARRETAPKTDSSVADRCIPEKLLAHLRTFRVGRAGGADDYLFPSPKDGGPLHASGIRKHHLAPLLRRLGIPHRSTHGFRHWLGATAAREGIPVPVLQEMLRHRDRRSTEVYTTMSTADADAGLALVQSRYIRAAENLLSTTAKRNDSESEKSD